MPLEAAFIEAFGNSRQPPTPSFHHRLSAFVSRLARRYGRFKSVKERAARGTRTDLRGTLARTFDATDIVSERGDAAIERVRELTGGLGAHSVLECVGHGEAMRTALSIVRPGGAVGRVGVRRRPPSPTRNPPSSTTSRLPTGPHSCAPIYRRASSGRSRRTNRAGPYIRSRDEYRGRSGWPPRHERTRSHQGDDHVLRSS